MFEQHKSPASAATLGTEMYKRNFGSNYVHAFSRHKEPTDLVLFPDEWYSGFKMPIDGKTVALVGNAKVTDSGRAIDLYDDVIRLNYPYNWRQHPTHDGKRLDIWAGLGKYEVWQPRDFHNQHSNFFAVDLAEKVSNARSIHCISHLHVDARFWAEINTRRLTDKFHIHWAAPVVFEEIEKTSFGYDSDFLSLITRRAYLETGYGGWPAWEILFTGVRTLLLVAMSNPKKIGIYGMNFFSDGERTPWDMHIMHLNIEAYTRIIWLAKAIGITVTEHN
ncbi:hypothetical protein [Agrobacterium rosae]|uniref:hypothetical protein n=1 Tax=Agrobacterium rosae TaxID=1972867 RepID=UPI003BA04EAD